MLMRAESAVARVARGHAAAAHPSLGQAPRQTAQETHIRVTAGLPGAAALAAVAAADHGGDGRP